MTSNIVIEPADREAYLSMSMLPEFDAADVRAGHWDKTTGIRAFAAHRIAERERCAAVAQKADLFEGDYLKNSDPRVTIAAAILAPQEAMG